MTFGPLFPATRRKNVRESSFELIRLIAQLMIVTYHIYLIAIIPTFDGVFNRAVCIPLHIGVPLFVLISGYWGIHISGKGLAKLLAQMLVYTAILLLIYDYLTDTGGVKSTISTFMIVSRSPRWFMRTYIILYLFSPVINKYLTDITPIQRLFLLSILLFISIYIGTFGNDPSLTDGKNLANFLTIYVVGNTLKTYEGIWRRWYTGILICLYLILNGLLMITYSIFDGGIIAKALYRLSFPYSSPILLANAVLFFIIVAKQPFKSKVVNYLASSSLAIYLLHCAYLISRLCWKPICIEVKGYIQNDYAFFFVAIAIALLLIAFCIVIDKLLTPLWAFSQRLGEKAERKAQSLSAKLISRSSSR